MLPDKLTCKMAMKREMASDGGGGDGDLSELLMSREFFAWYRVMQHVSEKRCHSIVACSFAKC